MTRQPAAAREHLRDFIDLIEATAGFTVPDTDHRTLDEAVEARSSSRSLSRDGYLRLLGRDEPELDRLLDLVTINETYFFREERHFHALRSVIFPELRAGRGPVKIWSATCATGEEAYSLAAFARAYLKKEFIVYATDLNGGSLESLERGEYQKNSFREDGASYHDLIYRNSRLTSGGVSINDDLKGSIKARRVNLYAGSLDAIPDDLDLVFFRNTLIYMKPGIKSLVVGRIADKITPGGRLFLASSEMPFILNGGLALTESDGVFFFTRRNAPASPDVHPARTPASRPGHAGAPASVSGTPRRALRLDSASLIRAAGRLAEDPSAEMRDGEPATIIAAMLLYALHFINRMNLAAARDIMNSVDACHRDELTWHLDGFLELMDGNPQGARRRFKKALELNERFWPARFYLASILKDSDRRKALVEFERCRRDLEESLARNEEPFRFLLEGFSGRYFLDICDSLIGTIKNQSRQDH